ncbi:GntR family transcriptional regulator [Cellulomonas hominis]|uniref:GntR family transcriptional regulator n=1 Tax=Cellulomonas hominis TaxID=156981 RepID=A0A7W8SGV4_9CELL|nr:GntR family transcriptional regulator [Cellulomonas hominis]MBB5474871.1 GntR family transcriptional regulator [Cellulomonas hominis]MBU5424504.1 GntR family transcriptional regulator [Cellulomonas hominis]NKY07013.1 GntR family transcriptional regulator [Cellulomonas hominis]NKY09428.1 GntR family transcriptional regulator [Cellulomonas hominis]
MRIAVSNSADAPLYEQVAEQIKVAVLAGELADGDALPSVRALARDLRISVITTTRAYAELEAEGFITTVPGKGAYVLPVDTALVREQLLRRVEDALGAAADAARLAGVDRDGLVEMLDVVLAEADGARR